MNRTIGYFLDAPAFLDEIKPDVLGFGGPILILVIFIIMNRTKLSLLVLGLLVVLLYVFSLTTGVLLQGLIGNRPSSFVAAFWAPVIYSSITTLLVWRMYKPPGKEPSNYDHLIQ